MIFDFIFVVQPLPCRGSCNGRGPNHDPPPPIPTIHWQQKNLNRGVFNKTLLPLQRE